MAAADWRENIKEYREPVNETRKWRLTEVGDREIDEDNNNADDYKLEVKYCRDWKTEERKNEKEKKNVNILIGSLRNK